jgi:hypothetical protein
MDMMLHQFEPPTAHTTVSASSLFLAPIFNMLIAKFGGLLTNNPQSIIEGDKPAMGRLVYQFCVHGAQVAVFVQAKLTTGSRDERLDAIAQVDP